MLCSIMYKRVREFVVYSILDPRALRSHLPICFQYLHSPMSTPVLPERPECQLTSLPEMAV